MTRRWLAVVVVAAMAVPAACTPASDAPSTVGSSSPTSPAPSEFASPPPGSPQTSPFASLEPTGEPSPPATAARPPRTVAPFTDRGKLATLLVAAERAIRAAETGQRDLARWARVQQQAYRDLVRRPGWRDDARAAIPRALRDAFDRNLRATSQLRQLTEPREELPDWRIVAPPPADRLRRIYRAAERELGVGWEVLAAIHLTETRMGRIRGTSTAGARGPMQFLPSTWEAYGEGDIDDPRDAIFAAARYLRASGAPDDLPGALYAYNNSDRYVDAILAHAAVLEDHPRAYRGYYHWRVYFRTVDGDVVLEPGYDGSPR